MAKKHPGGIEEKLKNIVNIQSTNPEEIKKEYKQYLSKTRIRAKVFDMTNQYDRDEWLALTNDPSKMFFSKESGGCIKYSSSTWDNNGHYRIFVIWEEKKTRD